MNEDLGQEIQLGFIVFDQYHRTMESLLQQGQKNLLAKIQRDFGPKVSLESFNPIVAQDFPRYLRYSFIMLLYSFIESKLEALCVKIGSDHNLSEDQVKKELGQAKLKNSKSFIRKKFIDKFQGSTNDSFSKSIDKIFDPILFLSKVRNCIAHADGDVSKSRDKNKLQEGEGKYKGFSIDNGIIFIKEDFCELVWRSAVSLFESILHL